MFYSAPPGTWQLLEERIDTSSPFPHGVTSGSDAADIDKHQQYVWGPRYIDDLVLDRLDANKNGTFTDTNDKNYFHCTDAQFTTVAVIDRFANVIERRSPDEYGRMRLCAPPIGGGISGRYNRPKKNPE